MQKVMIDEIIRDIRELVNLSYDTGWNAGSVEHGHQMMAYEQQDAINKRMAKHQRIVDKLKSMKEIF